MVYIKWVVLTLMVSTAILVTSCKDEYTKLVEDESEKNIRKDTLFLGLRFGMTPKEFFAYSWELNEAGLVSEGFSNTTILYQLARFGKRYEVNFYPNFHENKIVSLPVDYSYEVSAPWNSKYSLDTLYSEVVIMQKELYGNDFLTVPNDKRGDAMVRVDGNRRISIFRNFTKNSVTVLFRDLSVDLDNVQ